MAEDKKVVEKPKKEKVEKERELPKAGQYTAVDLEKAAKIYSPMGGKY
tara:strand:- start:586 stop:729 length:144 start_codon:yes stop_codon:yes gene_type:complete